MDSMRNGSIQDLYTSTGINDLWLGSSFTLGHPRNYPDLAPLLSDPNEPYQIPDRGILFKEDRYLMSNPANL